MNYIATVGEKDVKVSVEEVGGAGYRVSIDGVEHVVDAHPVAGTLWSILYGNESFEVDVTRLPSEEFEVLIQGDCHKFAMMNEQRRAMIRSGGKGAAGKAMVTCPMPGKVVKLLVSVGQEVRADQGVIVVEAMKMENELKSALAGKVKEIFVKEGEVVESGAKLLLVE
ncbi:MAG: acetyl-CoA carboxylase biotin carboxyl carrier protein subunit [Deltaproteobacteria bacterium]|nr:MAG: acetyl-CoA carboxylase biotin carboxyl carrier protein subunit [Deltaproteobacteria bacterium]